MAAQAVSIIPIAVSSEMPGGGSTTVSDEHEQHIVDAGEQKAEDLVQTHHQPKQSTGDLWPTSVVDNLIDQFEEIKVLKLNMGNLRSQHWCDIAANLNSTFKTSYDWKQCKNKVDLLIRLYKKSKTRMLQTDTPPTWRFFDRMDSILGRTFKPSVTNSKVNRSPVNVEPEEEEDEDEPPGHQNEEEQQHTVSSPLSSERADEIDFRTLAAAGSVRKKSKKSRSSTYSAINLLVGALNHYTQAFERCKQMEVEAQLRMSQESRAFQLQITQMQLEMTKEIVRVLGKRRRG